MPKLSREAVRHWQPMRFMVTGGAGFIGSAIARRLASDARNHVLVVDCLTYAGSLATLSQVADSANFTFAKCDICDQDRIAALLAEYRPEVILHLAAESHVDRSIAGPEVFIQTNVVGTYRLLEASLSYWKSLPVPARDHFRFHHVSTDEVYGDLDFDTGVFTELSSYAPTSPYSASKAASDHLVRAWHHTFGLPVSISNCSNNLGPFQFPEKLIPQTIIRAISERPLPVYGRGENVRDWLHVDDHVSAILDIVNRGRVGETYNVGARSERKNIDVVEQICALLDRIEPRQNGRRYAALIEFVTDRPGHDRRYAIDPAKLEDELGWRPQHDFENRLEDTVRWYLSNRRWWEPILGAPDPAGTQRAGAK